MKYVVVFLLLLSSLARGAGDGLTGSYYNQNAGTSNPSTQPFQGEMIQRVDPQINFNWGSASPGVGSVRADYFTVRWTGEIEFPTAGSYTLRTRSDDGVRLYLDRNRDGDFSDSGETLINNWTDHAVINNDSIAVPISTAGTRYPVRLEFYERGGSAVMQLSWLIPGSTTFAIIPTDNLYSTSSLALSSANAPCDGNGVEVHFNRPLDTASALTTANYAISGGKTVTGARLIDASSVLLQTTALEDAHTYTVTVNNVKDEQGNAINANSNASFIAKTGSYQPGLFGTYYTQNGVQREYFTGDEYNRVDAMLDYNWASGSPLQPVAADDFSVRWEGFIKPGVSGSYTISGASDDGVRIYIDGERIIDAWMDRSEAISNSLPVTLTAGRYHRVTVEMFERAGNAVARLQWGRSDLSRTAIPAANLYHCSPVATPIAAYTMDEGGWNGTDGEIKNSITSAHGIASAMSNAPAKICRGATFSALPATQEYITLPAGPSNGSVTNLTDFSLSAWVKFDSTAEQTVFAGTRGSGASQLHSLWLRRISATQWSLLLPAVQNTAITLTLPVTSTANWYHIGLVRRLSGVTLHLHDANGNLLASSSAAIANRNSISLEEIIAGFNPFAARSGSLGSNGRQMTGQIDELMLDDAALTSTQLRQAAMQARTCPNNTPASYNIVPATTQASTCQALPVTISALDAANQPMPAWSGSVRLRTSSNHGNWQDPDFPAQLDPLTDNNDDGSVGYTFSALENGVATVQLQNVHADDLIISVIDDANVLSANSAPVSFRDNAFTLVPTTPSTLTPPDVVAGRPQQLRAEMWSRDSGACAINSNYAGDIGLKVWKTPSANHPAVAVPPRLSSGTTADTTLGDSAPASNNLTATFSAGTATFNLSGNDIGQFAVQLLDDSSGYAVDATGNPRPIAGSLGNITIRPFGLRVEAIAADGQTNPGAANATAAAFVAAGETFTTRVTGVIWNSADDSEPADGVPDGHNDDIPDNNANLADNPATPSFGQENAQVVLQSTLTAPADGKSIALAGTTAVSNFSNGSGSTTVRHDEVGSIEIAANRQQYMGSAHDIHGRSGHVGRFTPAYFDITETHSAELGHGHGTCLFTLQGESLAWAIPPQITVTAKNAQGGTTENYGKDYWRITPPLASAITAQMLNPPTATTTQLQRVGSLTGYAFSGTDNYDGRATLTLDGDSFTFAKATSGRPGSGDTPFQPAITLTLPAAALTDSDGICHENSDGDCSDFLLDGSDNTGLSGTELRYARLKLTNAYGHTRATAELPAQVEFWQNLGVNQAFVAAVDENSGCIGTELDSNDITLADMQGPLQAAQVTPAFDGITGGGSGIVRLAADAGLSTEQATGMIRVEINVPVSLQEDSAGNGLENPWASATFGIYAPRDPLFNLQQRYR